MTPISQTFYSMALFMALVSLYLWAKRRRRVSRMVRRALEEMARSEPRP